jgi:hypothetical protein
MKSMLYTLVVLAALANTAQADIFCQAPASTNQMSVQIKTGQPISGSFYTKTIPVEVTVQGLRLYYKMNTIMQKYPVHTRLDVGIGYTIDLGKNFSIQLKDIDYAPPGYDYLLGFSGAYVEGITKYAIKLKCTYK